MRACVRACCVEWRKSFGRLLACFLPSQDPATSDAPRCPSSHSPSPCPLSPCSPQIIQPSTSHHVVHHLLHRRRGALAAVDDDGAPDPVAGRPLGPRDAHHPPPAARGRPGARAAGVCRRQLHRHVPARRPVQAEHALGARQRGGGPRRRRGARRRGPGHRRRRRGCHLLRRWRLCAVQCREQGQGRQAACRREHQARRCCAAPGSYWCVPLSASCL